MESELSYGPEHRPWRETLSEVAIAQDGEPLVSAPSVDPLSLDSHPNIPGLTGHLYQLTSSGLTAEQRERAMKEILAHLSEENGHFLSSQGDIHFKSDSVEEYATSTLLLGGGDPFVDGPCALNLKWMERSVLDYLASIWHAKWPHDPSDPESYWGYVMSLDTTESAYYCLHCARDYLSGKYIDQASNPTSSDGDPRKVDVYRQGHYDETSNPNAYKPVAFFSSEAHESLKKAAHLVNIPTFCSIGTQLYPNECPLGTAWPQCVPCEDGDAGPGTVDIEALAQLVDFFSGKGHPIVVVFNCGSHFKGACDDVERAGKVLIPILKKNGMYERTLQVNDTLCSRKGFWFHVDGVMGAFYMPFLEMAYRKGLTEEKPGPVFDFRLDFVASLAANFHTWCGSPWPCAVFMSRSSYQLHRTVSHFGFFDTVLSGARNLLSTVQLWTHIGSTSCEEQVKRVVECFKATRELEEELKKLQQEIGIDLWVARSPHSLVIQFRRPADNIVEKYHLATKTFFIGGELRKYTQLCQVDPKSTSALLKDLNHPDSFPVL